MHLLSTHKVAEYVQDLLFYLYRLFLPHILFDLLSFSLYSTPTSDMHTAWTDLTFSTYLCTQLQNHYSDAPSNPESLTKISYLNSSSRVFSKSL